MRQSVSGRRHGDAADHSRNLTCHFGDLGMGVVPKPFLRPISACYYYRRKIELLKISLSLFCGETAAFARTVMVIDPIGFPEKV
jgi:hypothetical protein